MNDLADKSLEPLMMLEGTWSGHGQSPLGPYQLDAVVEPRGRWLLLQHSIGHPESGDVSYVSTQVYGYDDDGLTLDYFDTAGAFRFKGARDGDRLRFEWQEGEFWKVSQYWEEPGGGVGFKYESMESDPHDGTVKLSVFEGTWVRR